jgi:hypothetical protein
MHAQVGVYCRKELRTQRVIDGKGTISVGREPRNTIVCDGPDVPASFPLVEREPGGCWLNFTEDMHGQVTLAGDATPLSFEELGAIAESHHGRKRLFVSDQAEERVDFGEYTLVLNMQPSRGGRWAGWAHAINPRARAAVGIIAIVGLAALIGLPIVARHGPSPLVPAAVTTAPTKAPRATAAEAPIVLPPMGISVWLGPPMAVVGAIVAPALTLPAISGAPATEAAGSGLRHATATSAVTVRLQTSGERGRERPVRAGGAAYFADGMLDPAVLTKEIERRKGAIVAAYEHALRRDPHLAGRVEVEFVIDRRGHVGDVAITLDSLGSAEVARRILTLLPTWRLPAPTSGAQRYAYPFLFRPVFGSPVL